MEMYKRKSIDLATKALESIIKSEQRGKIFYKKQKNGENANTKLFVDFAMKGEKYSDTNPIRFMVVGRAAGCFEECDNFNVINFIDYENVSINSAAINRCFKDATENKMEWVAKKPKYETSKRKKQTDRKAFFGFAKKVYLKLTAQDEDEEWYKNIIRTNLFKVIPLSGGNPSYYLRELQINETIEILKAEIEFYKPTHILIIDGKDHLSWIKGFQEDIVKSADKIGAKICFVDRPETRRQNDLLESVDKDFWTTA